MISKKAIALAVLAAVMTASTAQAQRWNPFDKKKGSGDVTQMALAEATACKAHKEAKKRPDKEIPGTGISLGGLKEKFAGELPPLCVVETPQGILVITTEMLDEATINASLALDMAQNILIPESKRIRLGIAQMLETRDGLNPKPAVSDQRVETGEALGKSADEIVKALDEMREKGAPLSPEVRQTLTQVSELLSKATYYQVETLVGLGLLNEAMADTKARSLLRGVSLEFAQKLPDRVKSVFTNFPKLSTVQSAITAVSDKSMVKDLEKAKKKAEKEGEKMARTQAGNSDAAARTLNF